MRHNRGKRQGAGTLAQYKMADGAKGAGDGPYFYRGGGTSTRIMTVSFFMGRSRPRQKRHQNKWGGRTKEKKGDLRAGRGRKKSAIYERRELGCRGERRDPLSQGMPSHDRV